jgi:serine-type D-Ala-D-Ala carboxypeptidase (penicillin-binding protein 5/6)
VIRLNIMKKIIFPFLLIIILVGSLPIGSWATQTDPVISAEAAILIDMKTGAVLYEKNADTVLEPASIAKVLTALLTIENLDLEETVTIEDDLECTREWHESLCRRNPNHQGLALWHAGSFLQ